MIRLFNRYIPSRDLLLFFTEGLIISLSVFLAIAIRYFFYGKSLFLYDHLILKIIFFTIVCQGTILYNDLYFKNLKDRNRLLFIKLFQSLGATSVIFPIIYFFIPVLIIGRGIFLITLIVLAPILLLWRFFFVNMVFFRNVDDKILIIGTGELAVEIGRKIVDKGYAGYKVAGFIDEDKGRVGQSLFNPKIIGTYDFGIKQTFTYPALILIYKTCYFISCITFVNYLSPYLYSQLPRTNDKNLIINIPKKNHI